jgi:hypothetical protein
MQQDDEARSSDDHPVLPLEEEKPEEDTVCTAVLSSGNSHSHTYSQPRTQAGFCQECGDSLSTVMHVTHGPCNSLNAQSSSNGSSNRPINIEEDLSQRALKVRRTVSTHIEHNIFNSPGGNCAVCGDSLSTPMHVANGPCI